MMFPYNSSIHTNTRTHRIPMPAYLKSYHSYKTKSTQKLKATLPNASSTLSLESEMEDTFVQINM